MEGEKSLSFQILANNQKQQQRVFADFSMFLLILQPKDVFENTKEQVLLCCWYTLSNIPQNSH